MRHWLKILLSLVEYIPCYIRFGCTRGKAGKFNASPSLTFFLVGIRSSFIRGGTFFLVKIKIFENKTFKESKLTPTSDNNFKFFYYNIAHFTKVKTRIIFVYGVYFQRPLPCILLTYFKALIVAIFSNSRARTQYFVIIFYEYNLEN